jgi:hypothetical protein
MDGTCGIRYRDEKWVQEFRLENLNERNLIRTLGMIGVIISTPYAS